MLARLAGMVSNHGGNILRSVNNTLPNGGFELRMVVQNLDTEKEALLKHSFKYCGIDLARVELV